MESIPLAFAVIMSVYSLVYIHSLELHTREMILLLPVTHES